ncbi:MAG TPA: hypothetical protein VFA33_11890 [Bryobacteraceae bacterium]|nr:hypothetical protein [Bryobacteraceae bacterium]
MPPAVPLFAGGPILRCLPLSGGMLLLESGLRRTPRFGAVAAAFQQAHQVCQSGVQTAAQIGVSGVYRHTYFSISLYQAHLDSLLARRVDAQRNVPHRIGARRRRPIRFCRRLKRRRGLGFRFDRRLRRHLAGCGRHSKQGASVSR